MSGTKSYLGGCTKAGSDTCQHAIEELLDYVEGRLPPEQHAALTAHFGYCPPCAKLLETYRETPCVIKRALDTLGMPADLKARVQSFLKDRCTGHKNKDT